MTDAREQQGAEELLKIMFTLDGTAELIVLDPDMRRRRREANLLCAIERMVTTCRIVLSEKRYSSRMKFDPTRMAGVMDELMVDMGIPDPEYVQGDMEHISRLFHANGERQFESALRGLDRAFAITAKGIDPSMKAAFERHRETLRELEDWFETYQDWFKA